MPHREIWNSTGEHAPELDRWWMIGLAILGPVFKASFDIRVSGVRNIPAPGGAILAPNHLSVLDPFVVALGAIRRGRATHFMTLTELANRRVLGWGLRRTGQIPISRGLGNWGVIEEMAGTVRAGSLAAIFPEGHLGTGPDLLPGQKGVARIALSAGAPVIPVGLWGTQHRWPRDGFRLSPPARPRVGLVFGEPIQPEGDPRSPPDVRAFTDRIMSSIAEVSARARELTLRPHRRRGRSSHS